MCLNLIGSQFKSISEVETILNEGYKMTEEKILAMKDNREEIEHQLKLIKSINELKALGY